MSTPNYEAKLAVLETEVCHLKDTYASMSDVLNKQTALLNKLSAAQDMSSHALNSKVDDIIKKQESLQSAFDTGEKVKVDQRVEHALDRQRARWLLAGMSIAVVALFELLLYFGKVLLAAANKG